MAYYDIDPQDIDPDTGRPYSNYSSPALDTSFHDGEMEGLSDVGDRDNEDDFLADMDSVDDELGDWARSRLNGGDSVPYLKMKLRAAMGVAETERAS